MCLKLLPKFRHDRRRTSPKSTVPKPPKSTVPYPTVDPRRNVNPTIRQTDVLYTKSMALNAFLPTTCCWHLNEVVKANTTYQFHPVELGLAAGPDPEPRPPPRPPNPEPPRPRPLPRPPAILCDALAAAAAFFAARFTPLAVARSSLSRSSTFLRSSSARHLAVTP